jgi:GNAT superfamily N-acetyltransferase
VRAWSDPAAERYLSAKHMLIASEFPEVSSWIAQADGQPVALIQTAGGYDHPQLRSLAMMVDPARRRRGYGRAAVQALLAQPVSAGLTLLAGIERGNQASARCFTAAGFGPGPHAEPGDHFVELHRPALAASTLPRCVAGRFPLVRRVTAGSESSETYGR